MIQSKLPNTGTTIFTIMSALAQKHQAINLAQGFPDFPMPEELCRYTFKAMQAGNNQYAPMPGLPILRSAIAEKILHLYGKAVDPDTEITITAGGTQALFCAIMALVHPGDEVIIIEPAYDSYAPAIRLAGGVPVPYALRAPDFILDIREISKLLTKRTRLLIINTPHNPPGTIIQSETMREIEALVCNNNLWCISDEVYEHLVYDGAEHASVLRYPELYARTMAIFSFGKTFHNTGWKMGYVIAPPELTIELRKIHQFNVFSVNTPAQYGLAKYLENKEHYLSLPAFYQKKRDFLQASMQQTKLKAIPCAGSYFQLYDYSAVSTLSEKEFAVWLTEHHGVATIPLSVFYSAGLDQKLVRLCFAKKEETLSAAVGRMIGLLNG